MQATQDLLDAAESKEKVEVGFGGSGGNGS